MQCKTMVSREIVLMVCMLLVLLLVVVLQLCELIPLVAMLMLQLCWVVTLMLLILLPDVLPVLQLPCKSVSLVLPLALVAVLFRLLLFGLLWLLLQKFVCQLPLWLHVLLDVLRLRLQLRRKSIRLQENVHECCDLDHNWCLISHNPRLHHLFPSRRLF